MSEESTVSTTPAKSNVIKETLIYAIVAAAIVFPIRFWIAQPFVVNGPSMDSTFHDGEYLIVDQISYRFNEPERGDVLIFKYPENPSKYFIKRLIGLPGETVVVRNDVVTIVNKDHPEGVTLSEPYINSKSFITKTLTLGPEEYFVMGDNRGVSSDSRVWGALPREDLVGRPLARLLPLTEIDFLPGKVSSTSIYNTP